MRLSGYIMMPMLMAMLSAGFASAAQDAGAGASASESASGVPKLVFEETSVDFGAFSPDTIQTHVFRFRNAGNAPLQLTRVFSDCGCTATRFTREAVLPDSTGTVRVQFDGSGRTPGSFIKRVRVSSNDPSSPEYLYVRGKVKMKK